MLFLYSRKTSSWSTQEIHLNKYIQEMVEKITGIIKKMYHENLPSTLAATVDCGRETVVMSTIPTITSTVIFLTIISTTSMPLSLPQKAILMPFMTPWWSMLDIPKLVFFPPSLTTSGDAYGLNWIFFRGHVQQLFLSCFFNNKVLERLAWWRDLFFYHWTVFLHSKFHW